MGPWLAADASPGVGAGASRTVIYCDRKGLASLRACRPHGAEQRRRPGEPPLQAHAALSGELAMDAPALFDYLF